MSVNEEKLVTLTLRGRAITYNPTAPPKKRSYKKKMTTTVASTQGIFVPPQSTMAGVRIAGSSSSCFGLNEQQQSTLNNFLLEQVLKATSNLKLSGFNAKVPVPVYDAEMMTSLSYFTQLENLFRSQGVSPHEFHTVVGTVLKDDKKCWYDNVAASIHSWDDFKACFTDRFDSIMVQERRRKLLWSKQQHHTESVEQFVNEVVNLSRQVSPDEAEYMSVLRAKNALVPELRLAIQIADVTALTINSLLEKAADAIDAIEKRDASLGRHTLLPPLTGFIPRNQQRNDHVPMQWHRHQLHSRENGNFSYQPPQQNQVMVGSIGEHFSQPRVSYSTPQFSERDTPPSQSRDMSQVQCYRCFSYGHFARNCQMQGEASVMHFSPVLNENASYGREAVDHESHEDEYYYDDTLHDEDEAYDYY